MALQDIIRAMITGDISAEEFLDFFSSLGLRDHNLVRDVHYQLLVSETLTGPIVPWDEADADALLASLHSPQADEFESRSPPTVEASASITDTEFQPWSPDFEAEVLKHEDLAEASLACLKDGEFKVGKKFYCARCHVHTYGCEAYARHRETHEPSSPVPGPSGLRNHMAMQRFQSVQTPPSVLQVGGADQPLPEAPYRIELTGTRRFARAVAVEKTYKVRFNDQWQERRLADLRAQLHGLFEELLARAREGINHNDLLRVVLRHDALNHAIVIPIQEESELNVEKILSKIENVLQSEENLAVDHSFQVIVGALHIPQGAGRKRITKLTGPDNSIHKKSSMVRIVNDDQICMARAIGVGLAKHCLVSDDEWKATKESHKYQTNPEILVNESKISKSGFKLITEKTRNEQKQLALLLCQKAGVPIDRTGTLNDLPAFEEAHRVRIAVVAASLGNKFIRVPDNHHEDWPLIFLYLVDHEGASHFHAITNIIGFFSAVYFCERCFKHYNTNTKHRCEITCLTCKSQNCPETDSTMSCRSCHMVCRSQDCFERHLIKKTKKNGDKGDVTLSQCDAYWKCTTCKKVLNRVKRPTKLHECGEWQCKCCRAWVCGEHRCFLFPEEPKKPVSKFVFFDFEATQDTLAQCAEGYAPEQPDGKCQRCFKSWCGQPRHVPNLVVAQNVCDACKDQDLIPDATCDKCGSRCNKCDAWDKETETFAHPPCPETCGFREILFRGDDTLNHFGDWLFSAQHKDATVLAHNMKGYDGVFLLEYLVSHSVRPSKVIYNGSKIMYMEVAKGLNIRILDSLNFLPMKLAALPKAFGLTELRKGYFPHFFNTRERQRYVSSYPEPKAYGADYMSTSERKAFLLWHEQKINSGAVFDFRREMEDYCRSDVDILRRACLEFRRLMLDATAVDPFQYVTIASVCMGIFKTRFLEAQYRASLEYPVGVIGPSKATLKKMPDGWFKYDKRTDQWEPLRSDTDIVEKRPVQSEIAQVSSDGYVSSDNYSKASIQWLEFVVELARRNGHTLRIQHALNGGEARIPYFKMDGPVYKRGCRDYKVDGLADKTVYEYHGCLWHGCPQCYPDRTVKNPKTGQTMDQMYALTQEKRTTLKALGYSYVCIWEHEWLARVRDETEVKEFLATLDVQDRLDPRESFFGGRTNAAKLRYDARESEKIKYVDFTSLYPYVNKYCRYPVGHPEIITDDFGDIGAYFGIAKVKILAPRGLYHPVLPYRSNGKLKFPLCRTCADTESRDVCNHADDRRAFVGTWCTPEIQKALDKGYSLIRIYEVYHWDDSTEYDRTTGAGGLFSSYVNTFLKFKQEASGWPEWCRSPEDHTKYVRDYLANEGVQLHPRHIEKNPGLRALAKLCLNSFWGKFGQRLNQGVSQFFHQSELDKFYKVLTDKTKKVTDFHVINEDHLHIEYEHQSGFVPEDMKTNIFLATFTTCWARLKLYDVLDRLGDRVLYYDTDSVIYVSRPGQYDPPLGDYLGELTDELEHGDYIEQFVSGGPKNYAYQTAEGKQTCKIRGFSLNHANGLLLNFDSVREMVGYVEPHHPTTYRKRALDDGEQPPAKAIVVGNPSKIRRDKYAHLLYSREEKKQYRVVYDKRVVLDNMETLPYGY